MGTKRAALAALTLLALTGCGAQQASTRASDGGSKDWSVSHTNTQTAPPQTALQQALAACNVTQTLAQVEDSGNTATLQWGLSSQALEQSDVKCVLDKAGMPSAYWQQMMKTRALDGMQHASWGSFKATWTYHPDDGANLILTDNL